MTASEKLQALYDNEINFEITTFWDGGWHYRLGDNMNGWKTAGDHIESLDALADYLWKDAKRFYPKAQCFKKPPPGRKRE